MRVAAIPQHSSVTNEHPTPPEVVEPARRLLGGFDIDPASTPEFNEAIRATKIYTKAHDGLIQPWSGRVWLNPPGGKLKLVDGRYQEARGGRCKSSMWVWWDRLSVLWNNGVIEAGFFVGFTLEILRTSQEGIAVQAFPRCYPRERLAFKGDDPTHANVLVYLPPRTESPATALRKLRAEFGFLGLCEGGSQ